jgi:cystathionine gamma-synthase
MVFPSSNYALSCREFITRMSPSPSPCVRIVHFFICPGAENGIKEDRTSSGDLYITFFPASHWPLSKSFWQHTGTGISSRFAEYCLRLLLQADGQNSTRGLTEADVAPPKSPIHGRNRHYFSKHHSRSSSFPSPTTSTSNEGRLNAEEETATAAYLEERYARNLHPNAAAEAKRSLRRRIAGVLVRDDGSTSGCSPTSRRQNGDEEDAAVGPSTRGVPNITEDDVFLFPGGMCAIWHTHQLLLNVLGNRKSVCWGYVHVSHSTVHLEASRY